jgi:RNA polymerase sigma-70 factor (ECF subfamily)
VDSSARSISGLAPNELAALAGDLPAFETMFRTNYPALCGFVVKFVNDPRLAEELVQDLFADLWAKRGEHSITTSVRAYLFSAARNRALNARKRLAVERRWVERAARGSELHATPGSPAEELEAAELRQRIRSALASLPERCRMVMHLKWLADLRSREVAEVLGISIKAVEAQLARGRAALREVLG